MISSRSQYYDFDNIDFYHLHIMKTGGIHLHNFLFNNVTNILVKNNVKVFNQRVRGHFAWEPANNNTYIISTFRDPVKRSVSHFMYLINQVYVIENNKKKPTIFDRSVNDHGLFHIKNFENPTIDDFFIWFYQKKDILSNFQIKNLYNDNHYILDASNLHLTNFNISSFNLNTAMQNLSKINILIKTENLTNEILSKSAIKIFNNFNINYNIDFKFPDKKINYHQPSYDFFTKLSKDNIKEIELLNSDDMNIYNTNSYFTSFES